MIDNIFRWFRVCNCCNTFYVAIILSFFWMVDDEQVKKWAWSAFLSSNSLRYGYINASPLLCAPKGSHLWINFIIVLFFEWLWLLITDDGYFHAIDLKTLVDQWSFSSKKIWLPPLRNMIVSPLSFYWDNIYIDVDSNGCI